MNDVLTESRPIRLKGRSFLALALTPELPLEDWLTRLDHLASRSAGFFLRRPVVLDVDGLDIDRSQLRELVDQLGKRNVRIMGIEGARQSLLGADLPPAMTDGRPAADYEAKMAEQAEKSETPEAEAAAETVITAEPLATKATPSIVVTQPVRSGQSLFFPEGDVTIIGSVASGAEVVAGGSIHIYGALRGRAMAGTTGNASARIFCRKLEAEGKAVQIWLDGEELKAGTLG
jgi:septum site-determining protein MinC